VVATGVVATGVVAAGVIASALVPAAVAPVGADTASPAAIAVGRLAQLVADDIANDGVQLIFGDERVRHFEPLQSMGPLDPEWDTVEN
jgi:hypothetical protein